MANGASLSNQNSGETDNTGSVVGFRDANAYLGELDLMNSTASSTTGSFTIGGVYSGKNTSGIGLFKILLIAAAGGIGYFLWKRYK